MGENTLKTKDGRCGRILFATSVLLIFTAFYLFVPRLFDSVDYGEGWGAFLLSNAVSFVFKIFVAVLCFLFVKKVLRRDIGITKKNFILGFFIYGSVMLLYCVSNFFSSFPFSYQGEEVNYSLAVKLIPVYFIRCLGIGIGEEAVWRVLGVNLYVYAFGERKGGKFLAVFIPSVIFGLAHLNNLISTPTLVYSTISQVFYATMIGFYFAVSYFKTGNVIPCILLHALFDFAYYVCRGFYPKEVLEEVIVKDTTPLGAFINATSNIPLFIFALLLFFNVFGKLKNQRKEKEEERKE